MKRKALLLLALAALAVLPYLPGVRYGFVYDDHGAIVENQFLAKPANLWRVLTLQTVREARVLDGQRPVLLASLLLDRWGDAQPRPWRYHATNIVLHATAVVLLFLLARQLAGRSPIGIATATACGLLMALHPAWSEAVQVPSYREDVLALVFLLAYLLADFIDRPALRWPLQLAALGLALGAKESAWVAPLLLVWMRCCVPAERRSPHAAALAAGVGLVMVAGYVALGYLGRPTQAMGISWNGLSLRWPDNLWTAPWIWWRYVALFVVPYPLLADRVVVPVVQVWDPRFILGVGGVLAVAWWALRHRRSHPWTAFSLGWLILAFGPVSNVVPLLNPMADRYLYGWAPGLILLVAPGLVGTLWRRRLLAALCVILLVMQQVDLRRWQHDRTLWEATARVEPRSARAQTWLGLLAKQQGDREEARLRFQRALEVNPQEVTALINLAIQEGEAGRLAVAERLLREAVQRRPEKAEAWANLAVALELQGRREEALESSEKARRLDVLGGGG